MLGPLDSGIRGLVPERQSGVTVVEDLVFGECMASVSCSAPRGSSQLPGSGFCCFRASNLDENAIRRLQAGPRAVSVNGHVTADTCMPAGRFNNAPWNPEKAQRVEGPAGHRDETLAVSRFQTVLSP